MQDDAISGWHAVQRIMPCHTVSVVSWNKPSYKFNQKSSGAHTCGHAPTCKLAHAHRRSKEASRRFLNKRSMSTGNGLGRPKAKIRHVGQDSAIWT